MSQADYDTIVIGSGFGGSVSALRLAQKGYRVAVVEAGRRWAPHEFPETNWEASKYVWAPRLGWHGIQRVDPLRHVVVLGGSGVGGGSLIYGNTLFTPLPSFFEQPEVGRFGGADALMPYFELARKMMGVVPNPRLAEPDRLLRETAAEYGRGHTFTPSPVGVYFGEPDVTVPDPYFRGDGPERTGCNSCGGCFLGCRYGAKNTLDQNYLYLAEQLGAVIVPETRVTRIRALSDDGRAGYALDVETTTDDSGGPRTLRARGLVIAAGVVGTLRLLLASRDQGGLPRLSSRLGHRVRTNSEVLVAVRARHRWADFSEGLAASSSVFPDEHTQVQIDRYPAGSDAVGPLSTLMVDGEGRLRTLRLVGEALRNPRDSLRLLNPIGFAKQTMLMVVMQDHESSLRIVRKRRRLPPFKPYLTSEVAGGRGVPTYIPIANDFARRLAARVDGIPMNSVAEIIFRAPISAHILGGCPMGETPAEGVIDLQHRAFGYHNLRVCDGSVIPVNLGVNPALSILALSERAMSFIPTKAGSPNAFRHLRVEKEWGVEPLVNPRAT